MTKRNCVVCLTLFVLAAGAIAAEHDYYRYLRYPKKLLSGVGRNTVEQEVSKAHEMARNSPHPEIKELMHYVFA